MTARVRVGAALVVTAFALGLPAPLVHAHGREPMLGAIAFDPSDPTHLVVRTTWALLESRDDGASWSWRCAAAVGYDRTTEDPMIAVTASHEIVAGTFDGIVRSEGGGCEWGLVDDPDAIGTYSIDVDRDPLDPSTVWAIQSPGAIDNTLIRSVDGGVSWEVVGTPRAGEPIVLLERLAIAPSDRARIYVSGASPATSTSPMRHAYFYRSDDGGETFVEREILLEGEERNVHVLAVDPTDPDRVFMRVTRRVTDEVPERLLVSEDGGETWATAASLLEITGLAISDDGTHVWVGGWDGAFLRSDLGGAAGTFVPVASDPDLRVRCLGWRPAMGGAPGELWVCVDDLVEPFALTRSSDLGETLERVWAFSDASPATGCGTCTGAGLVCPAYWDDVIFDLGLRVDGGSLDAMPGPLTRDAALPLECIDGAILPLDAGVGMDVGPVTAPTGGGCSARRSAGGQLLTWLLASVLATRLRRARPHAAV